MAIDFFVRWICHVYTHNHALIIRVRVVGQAGTHQLVMSTDQHMCVDYILVAYLAQGEFIVSSQNHLHGSGAKLEGNQALAIPCAKQVDY